jgi:Calcineurin-like phosphoesterase
LTDDTILLTVTGDLTANGASAQYGLADQFLSGRGRPRDPDLPHPDWQELSIPGNHDHWPGTNRIFGSPTAALAHYFPGPYPITLPPIPVWSGHRVRFILINSDEEVGPYSMSRLYARGSFVKQLASLANTLPPREEREIRVLIVHHSMMPSPPQGGAPTSGGVLEIETPTRRVLEAFLVDSDISVVLCGHRHISRLSIITASNGIQQTQTLEARCGTTTQRDKYPYTVLQHLGNNRALPPNTLLLHRLVERDDGVYWTSQIYWLTKNAQFVDSLGHVSALLPRHLA